VPPTSTLLRIARGSLAALAVACVARDSRHANEVVSKALDFIEANVEGRVIDVSVEIL